MILPKSSLHYRLYRWTYIHWGNGVPTQTNLCQYVRRIILGSLMIGFFWTVIVAMVVSVLTIPVMTVVANIDMYHKHRIFGMVLFDCLIVAVFATPVIIWLTSRKRTAFPKAKQPNIFSEWLKARKEKICPLVEFNNE